MFDFTAEQEEFRSFLKKFTREEVLPIAAQVDQENDIPWEFRKKMADAGLYTTILPKELGGRGWGQVELCIQEEELAWGSATISSTTLASTLCQTPFYLFGTKEQKEKFMVPIAKGEAVGSIGLTEPDAGSDFASIEATATKDGDDYILDGSKRYIDNTSVSQFFMFWCKTDTEIRPKHKGISTFVFERDREGFQVDEINDCIGLRGLGVGGFSCKNMRVPKDNLLGKEGEGFYHAMQMLERGRTPTAAICIGLAQGALDAGIDFAKKRIQFGKPLAQHQMIQHKIADMAAYTDAARLLTYRAADKIDKGGRSDKEASMAKYFSALAVNFVAKEAVQIHGARGCMKEFPVERMYRDARIYTIGEGTVEIQRMTVAKRMCEEAE